MSVENWTVFSLHGYSIRARAGIQKFDKLFIIILCTHFNRSQTRNLWNKWQIIFSLAKTANSSVYGESKIAICTNAFEFSCYVCVSRSLQDRITKSNRLFLFLLFAMGICHSALFASVDWFVCNRACDFGCYITFDATARNRYVLCAWHIDPR